MKSIPVSFCHCGTQKDPRAVQCKSCASRDQALKQWANAEKRQRIQSGIDAAQNKIRRRYIDLKYADFRMKKPDGRFFTFYWGEDERKHYIYRYQWMWQQAHGAIPAGMDVHHKNKDCTCDELDNLELLTSPAHSKLHLTEDRQREMIAARGQMYVGQMEYNCETCKQVFRRRQNGKANRYCSHDCRLKAIRNEWTCERCGVKFSGEADHGKPRRFCSRACYGKSDVPLSM